MNDFVNSDMTEDEVVVSRKWIKDSIAEFDDKYTVRFRKVDGSIRNMFVSKIEQTKAREARLVEDEAKTREGIPVQAFRKSPDHLMRVFEITNFSEYTGQWRSINLDTVVYFAKGFSIPDE